MVDSHSSGLYEQTESNSKHAQHRHTSTPFLIIMFYALLRHNGSRTYSSIHTHTVIHASTCTKNTQRLENSKTVKRNRTDKTRATLGLLYCAGECAGWRESTTNRTDSQLQQIFVIRNMTKKITQRNILKQFFEWQCLTQHSAALKTYSLSVVTFEHGYFTR